MSGKVIARVDSAAKSASISKYSPDRQGRESGRRQQSPDSYKPKPGKKEPESFDSFFARAIQEAAAGASDFDLLLKKIWEDNKKMQESAKTLARTGAEPPGIIENTWIWGMDSGFRPVTKI